jgi:hypothetical protein
MGLLGPDQEVAWGDDPGLLCENSWAEVAGAAGVSPTFPPH